MYLKAKYYLPVFHFHEYERKGTTSEVLMIRMIHVSDPNVVWVLLVANRGGYRNEFADPLYDATADPKGYETRSLEGWLGDDMDPWWLMVEKEPLK